MKNLYFLVTALILTSAAYSQVKYDDGPIITSGNFVTVGTWGRNNITFSFQNGTNDIPNDDERNAIREAFQIWADYGNLNFNEVANNADIVISWGVGNHGDGFPFDGVNGVLAHAYFPPPNGGSLSGDIHFDDDETWSLAIQATAAQPMDLVTVAAHEIGHALGLGHSNVACALMNPFYTGSHRYLAQDDVDGIQSIYGNRTVVRTTNLDCSGGTFFINNLPNGASVFWTSSNTSISTVVNSNNQGIVSRVGSANGNVRITGTITLPCGTTVIEFADIYIGIPPQPGQVSFPLIDPVFGKIQATIEPVSGATSYNWYKNGVLHSTHHGTFAQIPISKTQCDIEYDISVEAINSCGTSSQSHANAYVPCDNYFMVSPNPATSDITVSTNENKLQNTSSKTFGEVKIYDFQGTLKKYQKFNKVKSAKISISGLSSGTYLIEIVDGLYKERKQLLIQK